MIEEILYTSAPKGLKPGSQGFCTVSSTVGMAQSTAERLEALSGYRHAFPLTDPRAALNPLNHSHLTLRLAGRPTHVLSRIANAGHDYSGRSNKLAHHLAFEQKAAWPCGPARMLQATGVMVIAWDGTLQTFAPRTLAAPPLPGRIPLSAWKQCSGDHGWAGWVAEQLLQQPLPLHVIFAPNTPTLDLVREVLDLLPPARRWDITFSTYFTRLPAGVDCRLRFVLDETPEATSLRHDARACVLDLTRPLPPAQGGQLVATARSGLILNSSAGPAPQHTGHAEPSALSKAPPPIPLAVPAPPSTASAGPPRTLLPELDVEPFSSNRTTTRRPRKASATFRNVTITALLLLIAAAGWYASSGNLPLQKDPAPATPQVSSTNPAGANPLKPPADSRAPVSQMSNPDLSRRRKDAKPNAPDTPEPKLSAQPEPAPKLAAPNVQPSKRPAPIPVNKHNPFSLITSIIATAPAPAILWDWSVPESTAAAAPLPLLLSAPEPDLQIIPSAAFNKHAANSAATNSFQISIQLLPEQPRTWEVSATNGQTTVPVGRIQLQPATPDHPTGKSDIPPATTHLLQFQWNHQPDSLISTLVRWCPLELQAEGVSVGCVLRAPESLQPSSLSQFLSSGYSDAIPFSHEQFQALIPNDLSTLKAGIELYRDGEQAAFLEIPAAEQPAQILLDPDGRLTTAIPPATATTSISPDSEPVAFLSIRLQPPVLFKGAAGPPRIEAALKARIPRIGLVAATKPNRSEADTAFFSDLLNLKPRQTFTAEALQQAAAQLAGFTEEIDLRFSRDTASGDLGRKIQSSAGGQFEDAAKVCRQLHDKLSLLQKNLEAVETEQQQQRTSLLSSKQSEDAKEKQRSQLDGQIQQLEVQIQQTTAALDATKTLLPAVSGQQTWFTDNREPHVAALTRQVTGLRSTPLRIVFFVDFPDEATPPSVSRGRVRVMEVRLSDSPEATR